MSNSNRSHVTLELENTNRGQRSRSPSPRPRRDIVSAQQDAEPLVGNGEAERPPPARPETVDDEDDDRGTNEPFSPTPGNGVDDGFFPATTDNRNDRRRNENGFNDRNGGIPARRPNDTYEPEYRPGFVNINGVSTEIPDVNIYQQKKTLAQGMMDLALVSANANQLRYVLESNTRTLYFYFSIVLLIISLVFQVGVGVGLILNSRYNVRDNREICKANKINNYTTIAVFIITFVNVIITAFGVSSAPANMTA